MKETKPTISEKTLEAFLRQAEYVESLDPKADKYEKALKDLESLGDLAMNAARNEADITKQRNEIDRAWTELENKQAADKLQIKEKRFDNCVRYVLEVVGICAPLAFYGIWMKRGFKFEETGTFTSQTFRGLFNRFRPTK